jgi:hypothetical protein
MTVLPIDPPNLESHAAELVDWMELVALFGPYGIARTDALTSSLKQLEENDEEDIGEADKAFEQLRERIENEVELREKHLGDTYPFCLDGDGEELRLVEGWASPVYSFYLICLITSHVTASPILNKPPTGTLLTRLRNRVFQTLATLAISGLTRGPAVSVGWPRISGETIVELLQRASENGAGFNVRTPPGVYTSPDEKDGGIDVLGWTQEVTPPPTHLFFGQTASGGNWPGKPASEHARVFEANYMQDVATGNRQYATIIPFRVTDDRFWNSQNQFHRAVIDRLRLPPNAKVGLELFEAGTMVDEADQVGAVVDWLQEYRTVALS